MFVSLSEQRRLAKGPRAEWLVLFAICPGNGWCGKEGSDSPEATVEMDCPLCPPGACQVNVWSNFQSVGSRLAMSLSEP